MSDEDLAESAPYVETTTDPTLVFLPKALGFVLVVEVWATPPDNHLFVAQMLGVAGRPGMRMQRRLQRRRRCTCARNCKTPYWNSLILRAHCPALRTELRCSSSEQHMTSCQYSKWLVSVRSAVSWGAGVSGGHSNGGRTDRGAVQANRHQDMSSVYASPPVRIRCCSAVRTLPVVPSAPLGGDSCQHCRDECMAVRVGTCVSDGVCARGRTRSSTGQQILMYSAERME